MINKKFMILTIFIVSLLAITAVSAADNDTADVICMKMEDNIIINVEEADDGVCSVEENVTNDIINVEEVVTDEIVNGSDLEKNNVNKGDVTNNQGILGNDESQCNILSDDKMDVEILTVKSTYPSSSDYSVSVSNTIIGDDGGYISISISPAEGFTYYSCYYLKIYDSHDKEVISKLNYANYYHLGLEYWVDSGQLSVGTYTIKLVNYIDSKVMDTAKLTVKPTYPSSSDYSVSVSDVSINYGVGGSIFMRISPADGSTLYHYCYYLKVYDSNSNEKISQLFRGSSSYNSETYSVGPSELSAGTYTIKLVDYIDGKVMDTAKLTVKNTYPSSSDYSVNVSDISVNDSGSIPMTISSASGYSYKYCYYLKVYDSNGGEKISQFYSGTSSVAYKSCSISSYKLSPGTYNIKIINYKDNHVMDTAILRVKLNTYVSAKDIQTTYGSSKNLIVTLKDDNGILIGKTVSVKLNGVMYSGITNSSGQISIKVPSNLTPATYTALITFEGDNYYTASSGQVKVVVSKVTPKITIKSVSGYQGKSVRLTAIVKNDLGFRIKYCMVAFKINGKTYNVKTNSKGLAIFKIKIPKSEINKVSIKTKNGVVTKITYFKKIYNCTVTVSGNNYKSIPTKFKIISTNKKIDRFKIIKKQTKTITIPYKKNGYVEKILGHYIFAIYHEQNEKNIMGIRAGDKTLQKFIKFSSNAFYISYGQKIYPFKWLKSKFPDDIHYYSYEGNVYLYVIIKYTDYTFKKI